MSFKLPEGKTLEDVLAAIERVVSRLAPNFRFGYFTVEDIKQQGRLYALQGLSSGYDPSRPLESFIFSHVRNRLINYKRDNYKRTDCPCRLCYGMMSGQSKHPDGKYCDKFLVWQKRNIKKQNILSPLDISNISDECEKRTRTESTIVQDAEIKEIVEIIDRELPVEYRAQYLQMKEGLSVPKAKRTEIEEKVNEILKGGLYE